MVQTQVVEETTQTQEGTNGAAARRREQFIVAAVEQHEKHLVSYAYGFVGDIERARDIVQETFLRLCRAEIEDVEDHLAAWLHTVCRNLALDVRRKESRMKHMSDEQMNFSPGNGPAAALESSETRGLVLDTLAGLPANQQEAIRLKFHQGLRYREIAGVMDISVSNVGYLIHRGINTMRTKLSSPGIGFGEGGAL